MKEERDDKELLREFAQADSEAAFTALAEKHIDFVYSVALRQLRGNSSLARDASQMVFCELARRAGQLTGHHTLTPWLYTTARFVASRLYRTESRRLARETVYAMRTPDQSAPEVGWNDVEKVLEHAMEDLSAADREVVLLRYFRNEPFTAIGAAIGASENAARMRVGRALEKLRSALKQRGVTCPASVLGALLAANAIGVAPSGLAASIAAPAIASAAAVSLLPKTLTLFQSMIAAKVKVAAVLVLIAGPTTGWIAAQWKSARMENEIAEMRRRTAIQLEQAANPPGLERVSTEDLQRLRTDRSELMRLRAEVTQLRRQLAERPISAAVAGAAAQPEIDNFISQEEQRKERVKQLGIARMNVARDWGIAFYNFAELHGGFMPAGFDQANQTYPGSKPEILQMLGAPSVGGVDGDGFEIVYLGRIEDIANPAQAIIMRDKEPFDYSPDGAAHRTYLFADGHAEIHKAADGDFTRWEQERQPQLRDRASSE